MIDLLANGLSLWDWPTAFGLIFVGMVTGAFLLPADRPVPVAFDRRRRVLRTVALSMTVATSVGITFFVFILAFRLLENVPNAIRVLSTASQWLVFCAGLGFGLSLRERLRSR